MLSGRASSGGGGQPAEALAPHRPAIDRVVATMRESTDNPLSLRDMADVAYLSPYHFARVFKGVTGVPPGEFLGALRLERAKRLLLTTGLSVSEVCFEVGYESLGTFTTRFTRLVGVPPGRMRRLPEALGSASEAVREFEPAPRTSAVPDGGVVFRAGPCPEEALIFVGLFPGAIPQGRPVASTVLKEPGVGRLFPVPDGFYRLMAAALPCSDDPSKLLLPGDALRVGRQEHPISVRGGRSEDVADVKLRPPRSTDPPVLLALPALFLERLGAGKASNKEQDRRSGRVGARVTFGHERGS